MLLDTSRAMYYLTIITYSTLQYTLQEQYKRHALLIKRFKIFKRNFTRKIFLLTQDSKPP